MSDAEHQRSGQVRARSTPKSLVPTGEERDTPAIEPALFYTGLVAELYEPLRSVTQDPDPYARFIGVSGEPALELGCGDGHPLLVLRGRGIDVEGVDSSADMLDRCRRTADAKGLEVVLHHQKMESLDLGRRYRSIFLAGPTFNLLPDDGVVAGALDGIRRHLDDGGSALVPLFVPRPTPSDQLGEVRQATEEDGSVIRVAAVVERRDEGERLVETVMRYERSRGDATTVVERTWVLHWHSQVAFRSLAAAAGLETVAVLDAEGAPAGEGADQFAFWLQRTR